MDAFRVYVPPSTPKATIPSGGPSPRSHNRCSCTKIDGRSFIPTSGIDPSVDTDSWNPRDYTGRNCCSSSRSFGVRRFHLAGCRTSGRRGSASRRVCRHLVEIYCPLSCRLQKIFLLLPLNRPRPACCHHKVPQSRRSNC